MPGDEEVQPEEREQGSRCPGEERGRPEPDAEKGWHQHLGGRPRSLILQRGTVTLHNTHCLRGQDQEEVTVKVGSMLVALVALASGTSAPVWAADTQREERNSEIVRYYYPAKSLKLGEEGDVHFLVELNRDGKLHSCAITKSSGYPRLDQATCDMIVATAYFRGAERDGVRQISSHEGTVAWRLPAEYARREAPKPAAVTADIDPIICRRTLKLGSLYIKQKLCLTKSDWKFADDLAKQEVLRLQRSVPGRTFGLGL